MSKNWRTSVTELLGIFRGALLAIIPWIEKAKIKWKEGEAYDDWDNIAESIYQNIVCSSLKGDVTSRYPIAKYNFHYENYSAIDFIQVKSECYSHKILAFVAFQSHSSPLDTLKVAEINTSDIVLGYLYLKHDELEFVFVKNTGGKKEIIDKIEVML
jgi:hypothetical protein